MDIQNLSRDWSLVNLRASDPGGSRKGEVVGNHGVAGVQGKTQCRYQALEAFGKWKYTK